MALGSLIIACSDEAELGGDVGAPCSLLQPCGSTAVCDYHADGGPTCITRDGDVDGDGLPNAMDYCHHAPGGQYDEDGDGQGDSCDRCPISRPRDTPDTDNDTLDAPCDPNPSSDGDELLLFDGFQTLDPRWEGTTPSAWMIRGGELVATLATVPTQEFFKTNVVGKNAIAFEASFRVDKVEASATRHVVGVTATDPRPAGVAEMACYVTRADAAPGGDLVVVETNQGAMNQPAGDAFNTGNLYRAGGRASGTTAGCSVITNDTAVGTVQANITQDQLSQVSLTAHATTVRFQYVLVVGR